MMRDGFVGLIGPLHWLGLATNMRSIGSGNQGITKHAVSHLRPWPPSPTIPSFTHSDRTKSDELCKAVTEVP